MDEQKMYDVLIVGAGPIGLACAIEAQRRNLNYVVIEKGCIVNSIYHYPVLMRFFSTPDLLEIGDVPFITHGEKSTRAETMEYYRRVADSRELNVHLYEEVLNITGDKGNFEVLTQKDRYRAAKVIVAIGYFDEPRLLGVPGEELHKVTHYYREPHPYAGQKLLIIGSGNSAVEAALECYRHDAQVTMAIRSSDFHEGIKYWIRPDIDNRIKKGEITAYFNTKVAEINPHSVVLSTPEHPAFEIENDFVLALTGYKPDYGFLDKIGIMIGDDEYRTPEHDPHTYESNRKGIYLAGVVVGGLNTKKWFIENSRQHALDVFDDFVKS